jgi:hypothetical protein
VIIDNVTYPVFVQLLRYMYSGSVNIENLEECLDLIIVSDQYLIDSLKHVCENYVFKYLTVENVLLVLQVAERCRLQNLTGTCLDVASSNFSQLHTQRDQLLALKSDLLVQIIVTHSKSCNTKSPENMTISK